MEETIGLEGRQPTSRVLLWCVPRSLSTSITKCISFVDGMQVWFEPYSVCYENSTIGNPNFLPGNQKMSAYREKYISFKKRLHSSATYLEQTETLYDQRKFTYPWVKHQLEKANGKYIFVKCGTFAIEGVPASEYLPDVPFQETFLIRHPKNVFPSLKKAITGTIGEDMLNIDIIDAIPMRSPQRYYQQLYEKWETAKNTTGRTPVVMDTDELLVDPEQVLRQYFEAVGFPWNKSLLSWDPSPDVITRWNSSYSYMQSAISESQNVWYKRALNSSYFYKNQTQDSLMRSSQMYSRDVEICVTESMPFYNEMKKHCM